MNTDQFQREYSFPVLVKHQGDIYSFFFFLLFVMYVYDQCKCMESRSDDGVLSFIYASSLDWNKVT
jgi:hypothetical protein